MYCVIVVQMVCQTVQARLCYLHTSHLLGHRWHGVPAKSGCPRTINIDVRKVENAVRLQLSNWNAIKYSTDTPAASQKRVT